MMNVTMPRKKKGRRVLLLLGRSAIAAGTNTISWLVADIFSLYDADIKGDNNACVGCGWQWLQAIRTTPNAEMQDSILNLWHHHCRLHFLSKKVKGSVSNFEYCFEIYDLTMMMVRGGGVILLTKTNHRRGWWMTPASNGLAKAEAKILHVK
jgi:hypothetical protein